MQHASLRSFLLLGLSLCSARVIDEPVDCECPGPVKYYEALGCVPLFKNPDDCCPERYDCHHVKNVPSDKCVINNHVYAIGESLRAEHANPCDVNCFCRKDGDAPAAFNCAVVDCIDEPVPSGCYMQRNATECCEGPMVCPEKDEDRATCVVDGKTYRDGEFFQLAGQPKKYCYCGEGFTGDNIDDFCHEQKHACGVSPSPEDIIRTNCIPTYYYTQSLQTDCSVAYRCQNNNDRVLAKSTNSAGQAKSATSESAPTEMTCTFGNLTMEIGDELNQATDYSSVCVKCVCEVPPLPTCQRLPDADCDVTEHPKFKSG